MLAVYIPCKDKKEAAHIAEKLLNQKLIACANIFPSTSMYIWQGKKEESSEFVIFGKSVSEKFPLIQKEVRRLHSYDCPCITAWNIDFADQEYEKWVKESLVDGNRK
ncbi:divalent-cation tolerance protein CutA [Candidatus Woesearchaeota archaeon]|nr:divalent-cation tolerance protein CutA [Candidatus Woesearchaeota archaeon]